MQSMKVFITNSEIDKAKANKLFEQCAQICLSFFDFTIIFQEDSFTKCFSSHNENEVFLKT